MVELIHAQALKAVSGLKMLTPAYFKGEAVRMSFVVPIKLRF